MKKFKPFMLLALAMMLIFSLGQSVYAFKDTKGDPNEKKIASLREKGIVSGNAKNIFEPQGKLTYAAGVSLLVKGFDLNIDHIRFIKEPQATDYFPNLKNNQWYSQAFIIASLNGLEIPANVKADDIMTREQFAFHLFKAISKKGDYAFIEIYQMFKDEKDVSPGYMDSIQKLLSMSIIDLDKGNKFNPTKAIKRSDAVGWLYNAIEFVDKTPTIPEPIVKPYPIYNPQLTVTAVNADISKVVITAQVPHPGYTLQVGSIEFQGDEARISLILIDPDPDLIYPQVITDAQASTYISTAYKPVLAHSYISDNSISPSPSIAQ